MTTTHQTLTTDKSNIKITQLQQDIINNFQKGFPLCSNPYLAIAQKLSTKRHQVTEHSVFRTLSDLDSLGVTSRIGPVFDHKKAGASTLAALAVNDEDLDKVASIVNQFEQVNHNYARGSHFNITAYNLWFVVTASDPISLNNTLMRIELLTGLKVLILPMEASYHLDLAFTINVTGTVSPKVNDEFSTDAFSENIQPLSEIEPLTEIRLLTEVQKSQLRKLIEAGLPKQLQPYKELAQTINSTEPQVLAQLANWQQTGLIRRFGLVVKHRKLGYNANAMVVWNIESEKVDSIAAELSKREEVSLCYRRPRRLPDWPYNLFCMIHGTDKNFVLQQIKELTEQLSLNSIEKDILFSYKAYKQKGASYFKGNSVKNKERGAHG
jgi:DNA-binding Lrp family transcriptional regulator